MPEIANLTVKREECRCFFQVVPRPGEEGLTEEQERVIAMAAKPKIEAKLGVQLVSLRRDPMCFGSAPREPVTEQKIRSGIRYPRIQSSHDQQFREHEQLVKEVVGNIDNNAMVMIARAGWVGEWL